MWLYNNAYEAIKGGLFRGLHQLSVGILVPEFSLSAQQDINFLLHPLVEPQAPDFELLVTEAHLLLHSGNLIAAVEALVCARKALDFRVAFKLESVPEEPKLPSVAKSSEDISKFWGWGLVVTLADVVSVVLLSVAANHNGIFSSESAAAVLQLLDSIVEGCRSVGTLMSM